MHLPANRTMTRSSHSNLSSCAALVTAHTRVYFEFSMVKSANMYDNGINWGIVLNASSIEIADLIEVLVSLFGAGLVACAVVVVAEVFELLFCGQQNNGLIVREYGKLVVL